MSHSNGFTRSAKISLVVPPAYAAMGKRNRAEFGKPVPDKQSKVDGMACPICSGHKSYVIDSRYQQSSNSCRRRRQCTGCNYRFTTYELIAHESVLDYQI